MITHAAIEAAQAIVYEAMPPTPQYAWPLLCERAGAELWLKHENHTPTGAFKVRGGLVHMRRRRLAGNSGGVISATRGNHGQSIPFAARREGIPVTIVVPHGNSSEKNAAMRALGAELIETGDDFDTARQEAARIGRERGLDFIASFGDDLVQGVATYAYELFKSAGELDRVYVPIGLGSGICGVILVRDLLGLRTEVVGVVADEAPCYAQSFAAGKPVAANSSATFADGMAVRVPSPEAFEIIKRGAERIVTLTETEIAEAMRAIYAATHNTAEGAGAAAVAAALKEAAKNKGKRVACILSGGNVDGLKFAEVLRGGTPSP